MDVLDVAGELYALPPQEFTAARDDRARQARAAGERDVAQQVRRFARPTASAWAVNALVRGDPEVLDELLALGAALREAQDATGEHVRRLTARRRELLTAAVARARALAEDRGQPVSRAAADEVEATLRSAVADVDAARAVRSGRLTRPLAASGLGGVDVSGAVALPDSLPPAPAPLRLVGEPSEVSEPAAPAGSASQRGRGGSRRGGSRRSGDDAPRAVEPRAAQEQAARDQAEQARVEREALRRAATAAAAARDEAAEAETAAVARHEELRERVRGARRALHDLERQASAAAGAARAAREEHRRATQEARTAERAASRAEAPAPGRTL